MPANISSYIGREAAWHRMGTVTGRYMTWQEIERDGGLDYQVVKVQLYDPNGNAIEAWGTFRWNAVDIAANDATKVVFLGTVGKDYTVIQHGEGFRMVDQLIASVDGAHYETAGALGDGEKVWGLANLKFSINVGNDESKVYLLFHTGHDGSASHSYSTVITRVVCQNTLKLAVREGAMGAFRIQHTKNAGDRLAACHEALASLQENTLTVQEKLNYLANRKVTRESADKIFDRLFPKTEVEKDGVTVLESSTRRDNVLAQILELYESNDNDAFPEQRGSGYNLLNAVTAYTDHIRGNNVNQRARAESALFGPGNDLKSKAFEVIMEAADGMPMIAQSRTVYSAPSGKFTPVTTSGSPTLDEIIDGMVVGG